jgi:hypothetical protein
MWRKLHKTAIECDEGGRIKKDIIGIGGGM